MNKAAKSFQHIMAVRVPAKIRREKAPSSEIFDCEGVILILSQPAERIADYAVEDGSMKSISS